MSSSQTLYSVLITNGNINASPKDGFIDNLKIENYGQSLVTTPVGLTLALSEAKSRANFRFQEILQQIEMVTNVQLSEQENTTDPYTVSNATISTEATSFQFWVIAEKGDSSLITADEYNAGQYLYGASCLQRCIARALLLDAIREWPVFDPTDSVSVPSSTTSVIRYGTRIMTGFEIGPYASSLSNANSLIDVSLVTF